MLLSLLLLWGKLELANPVLRAENWIEVEA